mgnify:CR=1 FL=1
MSDEEYEYDYGSDYGDMEEDGSGDNEIGVEIENSFYEAVGVLHQVIISIYAQLYLNIYRKTR